MRLIFINILFVIALIGCECPPDIDTPKEIIPRDFSSVTVINAMPDFPELLLQNNNKILVNSMNYSNNFIQTEKLISGYSNLSLKLKSDSSVIYNTVINLTKDSNYTLVFYGIGKRNYTLFKIENQLIFNPEKSFIRFINANIDTLKKIKYLIEGKSNYNFNTNNKAFSEYFEIEPEKYNLKIINSANDSILINYGEINLEKNKVYNFVLKGSVKYKDNKKLNCQMIIKE